MIAFFATLQGKLVVIAVGFALAGGAVFWVYHEGGVAERGRQAEDQLKESEDARKARDKADRDAAGASDRDLINGVRPQNR